MAVIFPSWMRDRIKQGNDAPGQAIHPKGDSFAPYLCCRDASLKEERRAELGLDHWAFERWSREGHGQYLWHCSIPGAKEAKWHVSKDLPPNESPVLIYLMHPVLTLTAGYLAPGLYLGRCEWENYEHLWKAKYNRYVSKDFPEWLHLNNHKNNNQNPRLFWLPLPINKG